MKKVIVGIFCLLAFNQNVYAGNIGIGDSECLAAGEVELYMSDMIESVTGRIGTTEIRLNYYLDVIYGHIVGLEANLRIRGNRVVGKVGVNDINWSFSRRNSSIKGFQECLRGTITNN